MKDQPVLLLSIFRDFTENKIAEIETRNAKEKAEEINRLKSSFLANMSHELRTPLIGILGFAEILKNEIEDASLSEYASTIYLSGKRLAETLNSILDFSTLESEKQKKNFMPLNIVEIISDIAESNFRDAKEKNLTLEFKCTQPVIQVKVDKVMFSQLINNVVNNAVKFTVKGGVTINASVEQAENESRAKIEVIDSGIGIPEKFVNLIFEPFRQGSEGLNRNYQGTGLGLTIAKKYAELMGGKISVRSKIGIGSIFTIEFPAISTTEHTESPVKLENKITSPKEKPLLAEIPDILLVEDDQTNQLAVRYFLTGIVQLDVANNGETAVQMARTVKYSLILMDIGLKGEMNGLETAKVIRKIDGYQNIPIVAVSAFVMDGDKERFLNEGCTHYLPKPFLRGDLVKMVREILNLS
jgi:nitrogen-specific signal transduction histidine kinase/CheY-like chemotaxis protein